MAVFDFFSLNIKKGNKKLRSNPQPIYTFALALLIIGAFAFVAGRFVSIAINAENAASMSSFPLSQANVVINNEIKSNILLLAFILVFVIIFFLRYSRLNDYISIDRKLDEADQLKDDFISMTSNELRTPLMAIRSYASFITEDAGSSTKTREYAEKIDSAAKFLDTLVSDILDVSRIEQQRLPFVFKIIDPTHMIQDVVSIMEMPAKAKRLSLTFVNDTLTKPAHIRVDTDRLRQVLTNLIDNAIKYTPRGKILVRQYIDRGNDGKARLFIQVQDTGIGMSKDEQADLFQKFYRVRTKEVESVPGTGLGLWITVQILKEMEGEIYVESAKGDGSKFLVSFPALKKAA